jgi:hypothetical protein
MISLPLPSQRTGSSARSAYPRSITGLIPPSSPWCPLAVTVGMINATSLRPSQTTTSAHGSFAPGGFCCPSHPRSYDPLRQSRRLPQTSQIAWLYHGSVPDDLVWAVPETFPAL